MNDKGVIIHEIYGLPSAGPSRQASITFASPEAQHPRVGTACKGAGPYVVLHVGPEGERRGNLNVSISAEISLQISIEK